MRDIQPTSGDRVRFEAIVKCLVDGGTNLAILSEYDEVLDHFAREIQSRLNAALRCDIEFCTSTNSEQLVDKFNQLLGQLTLDEALDKEAQHAPRRYLIFRDSILVQEFEMQLLARLVKAFPAGNISVILLINSAHNHRGKLESFGKNLLKWHTETRAGAKREPLRDITQDSPIDPPVLRDVVTDRAAPAIGMLASAPSAMERVEPPMMTPLGEPVEADPAGSTADAVAPTPTRSFPWGLLFGVLLVSCLAVAILYRDRVAAEYDALKRYVGRTAPDPAATPVRAESATPNTPEATHSEPSAGKASDDEKEEVILSSTRNADSPSPPASPLPASSPTPPSTSAPPTPAPLALAPPPPPAAEKAAAEPAVADKPASDSLAASSSKPQVKPASANPSTAWADQLQPGTYVVQLAAFDTQEETLVFQRGHAVYANARVLKVRNKSGNKNYFVLVAGPMPNKAEAEAFMRSHPLLGKGWLRSSKSLKAQL